MMNTSSRWTTIGWMLSWSVTFSIAMSLTKMMSDQTSSMMIVFIRSIFGLVILAPLVMKQGITTIRTNYPFHHLARVFFSSFAMVCTYYAYSKLPLATATSIGFTGPCISVLLAMFIFSETVSPGKWAFIILGYMGVLVIAQPGSMVFHPALLVALLANLLASCSLITAKFLTKEESPEQITFINSFGRILLLGSVSFLFWSTPTPQDWYYLCLIGIFGTISQFSYITALKGGLVSLVAPFEYSRLVIALPIGFLVFAEIPSIWTFIGSLIIIASNFGLTFIDQKKKKELKQA